MKILTNKQEFITLISKETDHAEGNISQKQNREGKENIFSERIGWEQVKGKSFQFCEIVRCIEINITKEI